MSKDWKHRPAKNWKEVEYRLGRPKMVGTMVTFGIIWAITGFNTWVGFGLSMAILGMAGFFGKKSDHFNKEFWEDDDDYRDYEDDDDYYDNYKSGKNRDNKTNSENQASNAEHNQTAKEPVNLALHMQVIKDAEDDIVQLRAASNTASDDLGIHLRTMVANVEKVQKALEADANHLSQVQRLFTYYLPATTDLLKARGKAAAIGDGVKIKEIDAMIGRLEDAFEDFAARINGEDARSVEIDIKLLDQSLAQEFSHIEKSKV